jgi:glucose-1-phosphate adenylyltransferase
MGRSLPPAKLVVGENGNRSDVTMSLVSNGVIISGGHVRGSVLSPGVRIEDGAVVENSVLLDGVIVGPDAVVRNAVVDKNCIVRAGAKVGVDAKADRERYTISSGGVVVLEKDREALS